MSSGFHFGLLSILIFPLFLPLWFSIASSGNWNRNWNGVPSTGGAFNYPQPYPTNLD